MGAVHLLPPHVVAAISAGEVVERPLSVVKELVENAIDAGARRIEITIADGGRSLIRVRDDGCGMDRDDLALCIHRHATSKLADRDGLFDIHTMGFRGEALYSISRVASFTLTTRRHGDETGWTLVMEPDGDPAIMEAGAPAGTTVEVRDLFRNIPARRKFLKSTAWERQLVVEFVEQAALSRPGVAFHLAVENRQAVLLPATDSVEKRIFQLFPELHGQLLAGAAGSDGYAARCVLSPPDLAMAPFQAVFVNSRLVRDRVFMRLLRDVFDDQRKKCPFLFIDFTLPASDVDVNVHPAKREVRFADQQKVYLVARRALEAALRDGTAQPSVMTVDAGHGRPVDRAPGGGSGYGDAAPEPMPAGTVAEPLFAGYASSSASSPTRVIGTFAKGFILVESGDRLLVIDQHAAHERLLYNRLRAASDRGAVASVSILPFPLTVTESTRLLIEEQRPLLERLGFTCEQMGPRSFVLTAVPPLLSYDGAIEAFTALVEDREIWKSRGDVQAAALMMMACKEAVKKTDRLSTAEIDELLAYVGSDTERHCPHGRNFVITITLDELERKFGRRD